MHGAKMGQPKLLYIFTAILSYHFLFYPFPSYAWCAPGCMALHDTASCALPALPIFHLDSMLAPSHNNCCPLPCILWWVAGASDDVDELQFIVRPDGVVVFRSEARRARPDAPFCLTRGCISGAANRQSMEALRDALGWSVYGETDEDKQWVQILLH